MTTEFHTAWQVDRTECWFRERPCGNQMSHLKHLCPKMGQSLLDFLVSYCSNCTRQSSFCPLNTKYLHYSVATLDDGRKCLSFWWLIWGLAALRTWIFWMFSQAVWETDGEHVVILFPIWSSGQLLRLTGLFQHSGHDGSLLEITQSGSKDK